MDYKERITASASVMLGKPVIKETRVTVELLLRKLSEGVTIQELLEAYPHLIKDDILAALSYSADVISREELIET
ncbi:MAG: antitoxin [Planctomycetes bacterium RIFCSPHIGHO2_02_FULL_40_12]|nr:MAG: antitoxin [Planctomycetes bacterium RIFCSPHIGHO2_02_FULL_40_12]